MRITVLIVTTWMLIACTSFGLAQEYVLDWDTVHQSVGDQLPYSLGWEEAALPVAPAPREDGERSVAARSPEPEPLFELFELYDPFSDQAEESPPAQFDLLFSAHQYYDYYAERYKLVDRLEVAVYGEKGIFYQTFYNQGAFNTFDVYLNDLLEGDRYHVVVIWDDGSNRTLEETLDGYSYSTVVVDQPDALAYSY